MSQPFQQDTSNSLISLDKVGTTRSWNYSEPTLIIPGRFTARSPVNTSSFCTQFFERYPALKSMDWSNMALRGGAIIDILLGRTPKDLDFFFYGLETQEDVLDRSTQFLEYLLQSEREHVNNRNEKERKRVAEQDPRYHHGQPKITEINIKSVRRGSVISVQLSAIDVPIQIILCMHESLELLASTTDFAICGIVFDGQKVLLPPSAKFELENTAIFVSNRGSGYPMAKRIEKYFQKGFDIILPRLDVEKMPKEYLKIGLLDAIQTPSLAFVYNKIEGNKIHFERFITASGDSTDNEVLPCGYSTAETIDSHSVLYDNMRLLPRISLQRQIDLTATEPKTEDDLVGRFAVFAEGDYVMDVLKPWPDITARQVENTYPAISEQVFSDGKVSFVSYNQYVSIETLSSVLVRIAENTTKDKSVIKSCAEIMSDVMKRQIEAMKELCGKLQTEFEGKKPLVNEWSDFVRSLPKDPVAFYGDYLK